MPPTTNAATITANIYWLYKKMYPSNNWLFLKPNTYITSSLQLLGHHIVKFTEKYYSFQEFNVQVNHHHIYRV